MVNGVGEVNLREQLREAMNKIPKTENAFVKLLSSKVPSTENALIEEFSGSLNNKNLSDSELVKTAEKLMGDLKYPIHKDTGEFKDAVRKSLKEFEVSNKQEEVGGTKKGIAFSGNEKNNLVILRRDLAELLKDAAETIATEIYPENPDIEKVVDNIKSDLVTALERLSTLSTSISANINASNLPKVEEIGDVEEVKEVGKRRPIKREKIEPASVRNAKSGEIGIG